MTTPVRPARDPHDDAFDRLRVQADAIAVNRLEMPPTIEELGYAPELRQATTADVARARARPLGPTGEPTTLQRVHRAGSRAAEWVTEHPVQSARAVGEMLLPGARATNMAVQLPYAAGDVASGRPDAAIAGMLIAGALGHRAGRLRDFGPTIGKRGVKRIRLFHGTANPRPFEQFLDEYVGSGEGAAAYGWGHYFAQSPDVARGYGARGTWEVVSGPRADSDVDALMRLAFGGSPVSSERSYVQALLRESLKLPAEAPPETIVQALDHFISQKLRALKGVSQSPIAREILDESTKRRRQGTLLPLPEHLTPLRNLRRMWLENMDPVIFRSRTYADENAGKKLRSMVMGSGSAPLSRAARELTDAGFPTPTRDAMMHELFSQQELLDELASYVQPFRQGHLQYGYDFDQYREALDYVMENARRHRLRMALEEYIDRPVEVRDLQYRPGGQLYEVDLRVNPRRLLDLDVPIEQQPRPVRQAIHAVHRDLTKKQLTMLKVLRSTPVRPYMPKVTVRNELPGMTLLRWITLAAGFRSN